MGNDLGRPGERPARMAGLGQRYEEVDSRWPRGRRLRKGEITMKTAKHLDEEVVIRRGMEALVSALGSVEAVRFMTLTREKRTESVKRHRAWQETLSKDAFFGEIFRE
jgi:hypothetical protein